MRKQLRHALQAAASAVFRGVDGARKPRQGTRGKWRGTPGGRASAAASGPVSSSYGLTAPASHVTTTKRVSEHILKLDTRIMIYSTWLVSQTAKGAGEVNLPVCVFGRA